MTSQRARFAADPDRAYDEQVQRGIDEAEESYPAYTKSLITDQAYYGLCWPYHCKRCGGRGYHSWREPHGEMLSEPCLSCLCGGDHDGQPACPRCGERLSPGLKWAPDVIGAGPCDNCGWEMTDGGFPTW